MKSINKIFECLKESNLTMIGYKYQDERIKDELISKLPHIEIFEFDSSFSVMKDLTRTIRDEKIDSVLDGKGFSNVEFVVVDLGNFNTQKYDLSTSLGSMSRSRSISEFIGKMREELMETKYSLIILSPVNSNLIGESSSFGGGNRGVYMADVVYVIQGEKINIMKNRLGSDNITVSLDDLKDYKYICSYENNN